MAGRYKTIRTRPIYKGQRFDSKLELEWFILHEGETGKKIINLIRQRTFPLYVNGELICRYRADYDYFLYQATEGNHEVLDVKGHRTDIYKLKKKLMKAIYGIEVKEWPQAGDSRLPKGWYQALVDAGEVSG